MQSHRLKVTLLAGGIGGSRMARGFACLDDVDLTVVVNVGDDDLVYGQYVAADLDTMLYTLAGVEGEFGWGRKDESWAVMEELSRLGVDTSFRLGDLDLAVTMYRTGRMSEGATLSEITAELTKRLGVGSRLLPASDDPIHTHLQTSDGTWIDFQTYFVRRRHQDRVSAIEYRGIESARPAPGVTGAITDAEVLVIAPSNPILSIRPIVSIETVEATLRSRKSVVAIHPLVDGRAVKGPTVAVMEALGFSADERGLLEIYHGVVTHLVTDRPTEIQGVEILTTDTTIADIEDSARLAREVVAWVR